MRSDLVVVRPPDRDGVPGLRQRLEPMLVEAFVPEFAVETFNVAILHRAAGLNKDVPDPVALCPCHECATGEFGTVVGSHRTRMPAKQRRPVQQSSHILTADAVEVEHRSPPQCPRPRG